MTTAVETASLEELQRRKSFYDNAWTGAILFASMTAAAGWYFGLEVDVESVIWTLGGVALIQFAVNIRARKVETSLQLQNFVVITQFSGFVLMGLSWHLFGGLQQPFFPAFLLLPLCAGSLLLSFWQRQATLALFIVILASGVILTPDANSFIEQRYGFGLATELIPDWIPKSRVAFPDVSLSPAYDLMLTGTLAALAVALSAVSAGITSLFEHSIERSRSMQGELLAAQTLVQDLVLHSPCSEVLVVSATGRIVKASTRFAQNFDTPRDIEGQFLLDAVSFAYPAVIKRLILQGGKEIQSASARGHNVVMKVQAALVTAGSGQMTRLVIDNCDDLCWRSALDALDEPCMAIDARGEVMFLNRSAADIFGRAAEGANAAKLFDPAPSTASWWNIAPLDSARRMVDRGECKFMATIKRERIADSVGELFFVQLHQREMNHAASVA